MQPVELLTETRSICKRVCEGVDPAIADILPDGCRNNLRWQLGHILLTQQLLILTLSGRELTVSDEWRAWFAKGSSPADFSDNTPDWAELLGQMDALGEAVTGFVGKHEPDIALPKPYQTSTGPLLKTLGDAAHFSCVHEGLHTGVIMAYRRLIPAQGE